MFYIKSPDENIALHLLEEIIFTRLEYLEALYQNKQNAFVGNIEYLIEDSKYDISGHFLLRLLTSTSADVFSYWLKREALLFKHRLNHIFPRQLNRLFRRIIKQINEEYKNKFPIDTTLVKFSAYFLNAQTFYHIIDLNHSDTCEQYSIKVNFDLVPDLVKLREVELSKGQATIYCCQWREALVSLFQTFIHYRVYGEGLIRTNLNVLEDTRLISLNMRIQNTLPTRNLNRGNLTFDNIDNKVTKFPLCMRNLHNILRERHRLSHYARFYYTMFLKECGMKIDDVIQYWKLEYSKPHSCGSACTHNWQKDERKFVYSIRHMYGLEGRKADYKAPSCTAICKNIPGPNYEGGCPFKNFDTKTLHKLLDSCLSDTDMTKLLDGEETTHPQTMCKKFLMLSVNNVELDFEVSNPVQYFLKSCESNS